VLRRVGWGAMAIVLVALGWILLRRA